VNIYHIIDTIVNTHEIGTNNDDDDGAKASDSTATLLAHLAGRSPSMARNYHVLDTNHKLYRGKNQKVNVSEFEPGSLKLGDTTHYI
jgi:hypothetical protein